MQPEIYYLVHIALAVALSMIVGAEREFHAKSAGMRTHMLVGLGSALFMVISKYGFGDISDVPGYSLDGSRIAAQVASGIGFMGAGLIFVRRDTVRGLTTAASIWLVAAIGMAAGAGLYYISCGVVVIYLLVTTAISPLSRRMPHSRRTQNSLTIKYVDGKGILRDIIKALADVGVQVSGLEVLIGPGAVGTDPGRRAIILWLQGPPRSIANTVAAISDLEGVFDAHLSDEAH